MIFVDPDFTERLQRIARASGWASPPRPAQALGMWEEFVEECEHGDALDFSEYLNDLSVRSLPHKILDDPWAKRGTTYEPAFGNKRRERRPHPAEGPSADRSPTTRRPVHRTAGTAPPQGLAQDLERHAVTTADTWWSSAQVAPPQRAGSGPASAPLEWIALPGRPPILRPAGQHTGRRGPPRGMPLRIACDRALTPGPHTRWSAR
ncbi:hypothetical protein GCM10010377_72300 [Streptomyces viridiviolaceus]|nr:hypothetical protein GCM10010377_72300 [Streptomyces viridiviolaceus]